MQRTSMHLFVSSNMMSRMNEMSKHKIHPNFQQNLSHYFTEYSKNTGIHGVKYLGEKRRSLIEKIFWLSTFTIALYGCAYMILGSYNKWKTLPILVSFSQEPTPVWKIPFPAITICPENKIKQRIYNFTEAYHKMKSKQFITSNQIKKFSDISLVCDSHLYNKGNKTTTLDVVKYLVDVAPSFRETFFSCRWVSDNETCSNLFTPTLTEDGVCFTFNMLDRTELFTENVYIHDSINLSGGKKSEGWTLDKGYPSNCTRNTKPRRIISAGAASGLFLLLSGYKQDFDYICHGAVQGFKVLLHNPAEIPRVNSHFFRIPHNSEFLLNIKPELITTSLDLKTYDPQSRQCYFSEERQLYFFQIYTQQNCHVECLANYTLERCGCVAYHMPHMKTTKICGSGSLQCMNQAKNELLFKEASTKIDNNHDKTKILNCDCLPACTSLSYKAEMSQADFNWQEVFKSTRTNFSEFPGIQFTRIIILVNEMQFMSSERQELYDRTRFISKCGGLLNLFVGISFTSFIEITYFLTLRLILNIKKYGKHFWSGSTDM